MKEFAHTVNTIATDDSKVQWFMIWILVCGFAIASLAQTNTTADQIYNVPSEFQPTIKDALKFSDVPEIKDSVKRMDNLKYGIASAPIIQKYEVQKIEPAKLQNEPLSKLYHSLLKVGYSPVYNMPMGEFSYGSTRSRDVSFGAYLKHLSSSTHLANLGYGGFSDNVAKIYGKKFYRKHTLFSDFNYERNVIHYYGYDANNIKVSDDFTKQRYQLFEPKIRLLSHYTDSTHFNHDVQLSYYNLQNLNHETENNIKLNANGSTFLNKEKLNINFLTDYYNHKQNHDTINDLIVTLNPSMEANGKQWHVDFGVKATMDNFSNKNKFYFYLPLNFYYDVYDGYIIPYAGTGGGLTKNSFRSLSRENAFVDTTLNYKNTNNQFSVFGGLRGKLSSNTTYDSKVDFSQYDNLHFFVRNFNSNNTLNNRFNVIYDNATILTVSGQLKHQFGEKVNVIAKGNYYSYHTNTLLRAYQKPDFDFTLSGIYNIQSKILLKADVFVMGNQWAYSQISDNGTIVPKYKLINGWADVNLEADYRYTKLMSFFVRFNNIANQGYYRWSNYATQRFNFMLGFTFVPY